LTDEFDKVLIIPPLPEELFVKIQFVKLKELEEELIPPPSPVEELSAKTQLVISKESKREESESE
jgi:hypothetical protein